MIGGQLGSLNLDIIHHCTQEQIAELLQLVDTSQRELIETAQMKNFM